MAATAQLGCPCDACDRQWLPRHCFAASRRAPCLWQSHPCHLSRARAAIGFLDSSRARPRTLLRAARGLIHFSYAGPARTLMQKLRTVRRRIASYTAAAAQRRYVNNSRCALRYAGCRARCPRPRKNCFPETVRGGAYAPHAHTRRTRDDREFRERCMRAARATAYGCDP